MVGGERALSPLRLQFVIGDSVNLLPLRLEGLTKEYGIQVLVSEATMKELATPFAASRQGGGERQEGAGAVGVVHGSGGAGERKRYSPGRFEGRDLSSPRSFRGYLQGGEISRSTRMTARPSCSSPVPSLPWVPARGGLGQEPGSTPRNKTIPRLWPEVHLRSANF